MLAILSGQFPPAVGSPYTSNQLAEIASALESVLSREFKSVPKKPAMNTVNESAGLSALDKSMGLSCLSRLKPEALAGRVVT